MYFDYNSDHVDLIKISAILNDHVIDVRTELRKFSIHCMEIRIKNEWNKSTYENNLDINIIKSNHMLYRFFNHDKR